VKPAGLHPPPWVVLLAFSAALHFVSILGCELSGSDEPRVAGIAREMAITGDWLVPRLNGREFLEYPPLGYYPIALFLFLGGPWSLDKPWEILSVIPVALLGMSSVLLTYSLGKRMAGERAGLAAGYILSTTVGFYLLHRRCLVDPALLFFVLVSLFGFAAFAQDPERRFRGLALFYLGLAAGFLTKGLIGIALPAAIALGDLIVRRDFTLLKSLRPIRGALLFALPIALWGGGLWLRGEPGLFQEVIRQSVWRFFSSSADHHQPFYYYLSHLAPNLIPWLVLPLTLVWFLFLARRKRPLTPGERPLAVLSMVWILTVLIGLSAASAKRVLYLAPIFPAFALLSGLAWSRMAGEFPRMRRLEAPVLVFLFLALSGFHFLKLLPDEREDSFQPVFAAAAAEGKDLPVFISNPFKIPSEALRGAAVFYLGKTVPIIDESLEGLGPDRPPQVVIASLSEGAESRGPLFASLTARGFHLVFEKKIGRPMIQVYSSVRR
jgi:4-amino-4-deoxy-L-arabinose transferase-like glycosyltransferase